MIGLGNMGTAIANLCAENGNDVLGYEYDAKAVDEVNSRHTNSRYLPGVRLSEKLSATQDICSVLQRRIVFIALPSAYIRPTFSPIRCSASQDTVIVNLAKGIERSSGRTSFQIIREIFSENSCVMLSGPSIANEFGKGMPTIVMVGGEDHDSVSQVSKVLSSSHFRARLSDDAVGVELGGILKNIYAVGLGIFEGRGMRSTNFISLYMTFALEEMQRIGTVMGGKRETFYDLPGLGDLIATSLSEHSHNRKLGVYLAKGMTLEEIKEKMGVLPEGYNTLVTVLGVAKEKEIKLPIAKQLLAIAEGKGTIEEFMQELESR